MIINATLLNIYNICRRELWLHAHAIRMEHTSEVVYEGKLIGETTYPQRAGRYTQVEISHSLLPEAGNTIRHDILATAKIDFYDPHEGVVHEVKKSDAKENAHIIQVRFYLYLLRKKQIKASYGILEYPKLRHTERVTLDPIQEKALEQQLTAVYEVVAAPHCPPPLPKSKCRSCSYFDFCWTSEDE